MSLESIEENIHDIAGIRVICSFPEDIYLLSHCLLQQDDIKLIEVKDYIKNPKGNGYRSYHMIIEIPVFFSDKTMNMRVEIQIRTIAQDFWASLEHELRYKKDIEWSKEIGEELRDCAEVINKTDRKMMAIRNHIDEQKKSNQKK